MTLVWLNGHFVPLSDAKVSAFDAGFQHGVGLFETMLARGGQAVRGMEHLQRLQTSARTLRLADSLRLEPLLDAVELTLHKNSLADARVRLTLTGGDLNLLRGTHALRASFPSDKHPDVSAEQDAAGEDKNRHPAPPVDPTILIHAQPPTQYPRAFFEKGITVTIADARLNPFDPFAAHKTLNYWPRLRALQAAAAVGAGEALWFTVTNHLAGGSVSNVVLVKDGALFTPIVRGEEAEVAGEGAMTMPSPVLPGITRAMLLDHAAALGLAVNRRMLDINDVLAADEVLLTNSSWGVLPVVQVERRTIGDGKVGRLTQSLRQALLRASADNQPDD